MPALCLELTRRSGTAACCSSRVRSAHRSSPSAGLVPAPEPRPSAGRCRPEWSGRCCSRPITTMRLPRATGSQPGDHPRPWSPASEPRSTAPWSSSPQPAPPSTPKRTGGRSGQPPSVASPEGRSARRPRLPPHLLDLAGGRRHPGPGHRRADGPPGQRAGDIRTMPSGPHYRHTTPEMAGRVVAAVEERLVVVLATAETALDEHPGDAKR